MSEDAEKPKPVEKNDLTEAASAKSRKDANANMEQFVDEQRNIRSAHKAKGLSDEPRDISNTFKRVGIVELRPDGEEIVHVAESESAQKIPNQPQLGFEKATRADGGVLLKGTIPGHDIDEQSRKTSAFDGGTFGAITPAMLERSATNSKAAPLVSDGARVYDGTRTNDYSQDSPISPERHLAALKATEFLKHEIARLNGIQKLANLNIADDDLGYALGAYLLTPDLADKLGPDQTRRLGQNMLVFGIAPAFGMADKANEQITKHFWETVNKGSGDILTGSAFGTIAELNPVVASVTGIVLGAAFFGDQLLNPTNQARNVEVLDILSKTGNSDIDNLINHCDRTKELLGPEAYNASFATITGGIGFGPGRTVGRGIKEEIAYFDWKLATSNAERHLQQMPGAILSALSEMTGTDQRWHPVAVAANELPSFFAMHSSPPEKPSGLKMSGYEHEGSDVPSKKSSLTPFPLTGIESLTRDLQSIAPEKTPELVNKLEALSMRSDFDERVKIIEFLVREKQLHSDSPVDLDLIVRPIDLGHLKEYQLAIQNFGLMDGNNLKNFRPEDIPKLQRDMLTRLERFSKATETGQGVEETGQGVEEAGRAVKKANDGVELVIEKSDIIFKPGIYEFTIEKAEAQFASTPHRRRLFESFKELAKDLKEAGCKRIFLDGSFITRKDKPGDFDACWEPFELVNRPKDAFLIDESVEGWKARKAKYLGDIFPRHADKYGDRVEKWQFDERTERQKGIIFIDL